MTRCAASLTLIIISRFILNLRRFSQHSGDPLESESWSTGGPEDARSLPRSYLSSIFFRSRGPVDHAGSLHDGIVVKVSTYTDADFDDGDGEAIALQHVHLDDAHRRRSELPSYRHQSFDPRDFSHIQKGEAL